jgi:hypothetical protein
LPFPSSPFGRGDRQTLDFLGAGVAPSSSTISIQYLFLLVSIHLLEQQKPPNPGKRKEHRFKETAQEF